MQQSTVTESKNAKKRKFRVVTPELAEKIVSVRKYFEEEKTLSKRVNVNCVVDRTAQCLGVSSSLVVKVTRKVQEGEEFPVAETRDRDMVVSEEYVPQVRK